MFIYIYGSLQPSFRPIETQIRAAARNNDAQQSERTGDGANSQVETPPGAKAGSSSPPAGSAPPAGQASPSAGKSASGARDSAGKAGGTKLVGDEPLYTKPGTFLDKHQSPSSDLKTKLAEFDSSPEFQKWSGGNVIRDKSGLPQIFYHGTRRNPKAFNSLKGRKYNAEKDSVRTPIFFTDDPEFASNYSEFNAIPNDDGMVKKSQVLPAILKSGKMWDYENPRHVAEASAALNLSPKDIRQLEEGSWRLTESPRFQQYLADKNYDGFHNWELTAKNTAVFDPNQAKSPFNTGEFALDNNNILYARPMTPDGRRAVLYGTKDTKNLVVAHNLSEPSLLFTDKLGGLAMPSLAITKKDAGFDNYGAITLLADKSLIDPKSRVPVTDADMYSPRYPSVHNQINKAAFNKAFDNIWETIKDEKSKIDYSLDYDLSAHYQLGKIENDGIDSLLNNAAFKVFYLKKTGQQIPNNIHDIREIFYDKEKGNQLKHFAEDFLKPLVKDVKISKNSGRYVPYTLENVVKDMKARMSQGEGFNYGVGNLRAKTAKRYKSIAEMQADRHRILPKKELEAIKTDMSDKFLNLYDKYKQYYPNAEKTFGMLDKFSEAIGEGLQRKNLKRSLEEYGFEGIEDYKPIEKYLNELASQPTEYFEAKPQRAVDLSEFAVAVVPNDISDEARNILKRNRLKIVEYDPDDKTARQKAIDTATTESPDLLFNKAFSTPQAKSLIDDLEAHAEAFSKLKTPEQRDEFIKDRIRNVEVNVDGNLIEANPDFIELFRQAHAVAFDNAIGKQTTFLGAYQNSRHTAQVGDALYQVIGGQTDYDLRQKVNKLMSAYGTAAQASEHGDVRIIATNKNAPEGLKVARQEESNHQANSRAAARDAFTPKVAIVPSVNKSLNNLDEEGYGHLSLTNKLDEVFAKSLTDDAESLLNISEKEVDDNLDALYNALEESNIDLEHYAREVESNSKRGEQFAEHIRNNQSGKHLGETQPAGTRESNPLAESTSPIRERRNGAGQTNLKEQPANNGSGVLEGNRSAGEISPIFAKSEDEIYDELQNLADLNDAEAIVRAARVSYSITEDGIEAAPEHIDIIRRLEKESLIEGIKYTTKAAASVYEDLQDLAANYTGKTKDFLQTFAKDILQTAARDSNVIISTPERMAHELHHSASELGAGSASLKHRVNQTEGVKRKEFAIAEPKLRNLKYGRGKNGGYDELIEELMSHVIEGRHETVGLSEKQGLTWAKWWYNSYALQGHNLFHPRFDRAVKDNKDIRKVLENARRSNTVLRSQAENSGRETDGESKGNRAESERGNTADNRRLLSGTEGRQSVGRISEQSEKENQALAANDPLYARSTLVRAALDKLDGALSDPKNFSKIGAIEGVINKNLQELRAADEDAYTEVLKMGGSQSEAMARAIGNNAPLTGDLIRAIQDRNLKDMRGMLVNTGLAIQVKANEPTPTVVAGKTASVVRIGGVPYAMPAALVKELRPVLESAPPPAALNKISNAVNKISLAGVTGGAMHTYNLVSTIIAGTPYAGTDILSRTVGNTPATKWLASMINICRADPTKVDPKQLVEMAQAGVLPSSWGKETYSKKMAADLNAHLQRYSLGAFLHGPKGLDIRTRLLLWDIGKHINQSASAAEMNDFVNQLGIYNRGLESQIARGAKGSGVAPFYTAGSQMYKNSVLMPMGRNPMPTEGMSFAARASLRAQQQLGGTLGMVALWVGLSLLVTKMLPWKDKDSRFLMIPVPDEHRHNALMNAIYGDNDKKAYVGLGFASPLISRGARALGVSGAYDTAILGGTGQQMFEAGAKDAVNSIAHPITSSPSVKAAIMAVAGAEPSIESLREYKTGKSQVNFYKPYDIPQDSGILRNIAESGMDLNPAIGGILHSLGVNRKDPDKLTTGELTVIDHLLNLGKEVPKAIIDTAFPRLDAGAQDRDKKREQVAKEAQAIERNAQNGGAGGRKVKPPPGMKFR
ncbi:MAG: hypothetical protein ACR2N3_13995 [Pyrinomonadaceae bacterium]